MIQITTFQVQAAKQIAVRDAWSGARWLKAHNTLASELGIRYANGLGCTSLCKSLLYHWELAAYAFRNGLF
jgi:hypothetical protein